MDYTNQYKIILKLNDKDKYAKYPLLLAIMNNNIEMVDL